MNPQIAVDIVSKIPTNGDVVLEAAKWVFFLILLIGAGSVPFMMILNKKNKDQNENKLEKAMAGAGSSLYTQLASQVEEYRRTAHEAYKDRDDLLIRVTRLESMTEQFELSKQTVDKLRIKLDLKDQEIRALLTQAAEERAIFLSVLVAKDRDIVVRDERITQLERAVHEMEIRLVKDESRQMFSVSHACPFISTSPTGEVHVTTIDAHELS